MPNLLAFLIKKNRQLQHSRCIIALQASALQLWTILNIYCGTTGPQNKHFSTILHTYCMSSYWFSVRNTRGFSGEVALHLLTPNISEGTNTSMHGTEKRRPPLWNGNSSVCSSGVSLWWWILLEAVSFLLWCGGCRQRPYSGPSSGCSHWRTMLCNACETDAVTGNTQRHVKRRVHLLANITVL